MKKFIVAALFVIAAPATIASEGKGYEFLFADIAELVTISPDHLPGIIKARIQTHKEDEAARLEADREKIRKEEEANARATVEAKATDLHGPHGSVAYPAGAGEVRSPEKPRIRQHAEPAKARPTDEAIIHVLMATYQADRATVIGWLKEMNLEEAA